MKNLENYSKNDYYFKRTLEKEKNDLLWYIDSCKKRIDILKSIKRIHKKDWSNFQNFLKNFELKDWSIYYDYNDIVFSRNWEKAYIHRYSIDKDFIENIRKIDPKRIIKLAYELEKIEYNENEIEIEIQKSIKKEKQYLEKLEKQLKNFDKNIDKLSKKLDQFLIFLSSLDNYSNFKNICKETIEHFYL